MCPTVEGYNPTVLPVPESHQFFSYLYYHHGIVDKQILAVDEKEVGNKYR